MSLSILPTVPTQDLTITDDGYQFFLTVWTQAASAVWSGLVPFSQHVFAPCA